LPSDFVRKDGSSNDRLNGDFPMRAIAIALSAILAVMMPGAAPAEAPKDIKGLYLLTDYPSVSIRPGSTSTLSLRLQNYGLAPERYQLSVDGVPAGWTATLMGGGQPVAAAMPAPDSSVGLQLRLDVPANAGGGTHALTVNAVGSGNKVSLPITVALAKELPAKLVLEPRLPALRGSPRSSFDYQLTIKNDSGRNVIASFAAEAPRNFATTFTESYGSQELSSIPIEAGQSKDIKLSVRPSSNADAGRYPVKVTVRAEDATVSADLALEIVGQPQIQISGRDGLVSAKAEAGQQSTVPLILANTGSAAADQIELAANAPNGWKVEFEPKTVERIEPGKTAEVQALITPAAKSLNGDYMTTIRASSRGETSSTQFRVSVTTSTLWGMTGAGVIAAALLVMVGAIARFGRR
jgi:uncharacterized membrane protein